MSSIEKKSFKEDKTKKIVDFVRGTNNKEKAISNALTNLKERTDTFSPLKDLKNSCNNKRGERGEIENILLEANFYSKFQQDRKSFLRFVLGEDFENVEESIKEELLKDEEKRLDYQNYLFLKYLEKNNQEFYDLFLRLNNIITEIKDFKVYKKQESLLKIRDYLDRKKKENQKKSLENNHSSQLSQESLTDFSFLLNSFSVRYTRFFRR
jgi:hypothetical protein